MSNPLSPALDTTNKLNLILRLRRISSLAVRISIRVIIFIVFIRIGILFFVCFEPVALLETGEWLDLCFEAGGGKAFDYAL